MTCCEGLAKCFLILFNTVFLVLGALFLGLGILLKFFLDTFLESSLGSSLPFDVSSVTALPPPFGDLLTDVTDIAGIAFIVLGGVMFFVGAMGCCGACCKNKCCLSVYIVCVAILLGGQIAAAVYFFLEKDSLETMARTELQTMINLEYAGDNDTSAVSLGWTLIDKAYECCGVSGYLDFWNATQWQRNFTYNYTSGGLSFPFTVTLATPLSCCQFEGGFLSTAFTNPNCSVAPDPTYSNYETGCFDKMMTLVDGAPMITVIVVCGSTFLVQLLLIVFACCLCRKKKEDDVTKF